MRHLLPSRSSPNVQDNVHIQGYTELFLDLVLIKLGVYVGCMTSMCLHDEDKDRCLYDGDWCLHDGD